MVSCHNIEDWGGISVAKETGNQENYKKDG
jgi:hypothetical protein